MTIDAELNRKFPFGTDLHKDIARFTQVKNESREAWHDIQFLQYT